MKQGMNMSVRFFAYEFDDDLDQWDVREFPEDIWLDIDAPIEYERHTVFQNGVSQICLTKRNI